MYLQPISVYNVPASVFSLNYFKSVSQLLINLYPETEPRFWWPKIEFTVKRADPGFGWTRIRFQIPDFMTTHVNIEEVYKVKKICNFFYFQATHEGLLTSGKPPALRRKHPSVNLGLVSIIYKKPLWAYMYFSTFLAPQKVSILCRDHLESRSLSSTV